LNNFISLHYIAWALQKLLRAGSLPGKPTAGVKHGGIEKDSPDCPQAAFPGFCRFSRFPKQGFPFGASRLDKSPILPVGKIHPIEAIDVIAPVLGQLRPRLKRVERDRFSRARSSLAPSPSDPILNDTLTMSNNG